jgi:Flp pilus assembly protein TadG
MIRLRNWRACPRNFARGNGGAEIAETAIVLPLLFMFLLAIFWFGQAYHIYGVITHAARQGARAAIAPPCATCSSTNDPSANAWAAVQTAMQAANLDPTKLKQPNTPPALCSCSPTANTTTCTSTTVACDGEEPNICVQGVTHPGGNSNPPTVDDVQLSAPGQGGAGECGISVSFQYPYSFPLPFASINNSTVPIQAQAQMRAETQ